MKSRWKKWCGGVLVLHGVVLAYQPKERIGINSVPAVHDAQTLHFIASAGDFKAHVLGNKELAVVCLTQTRSSTHQVIGRIARSLKQQFSERVVVYGMDVTDKSIASVVQQLLAQIKQPSLALPAFLLFKQGTMVLPIITGIENSQQLTPFIEKLLAS
jgi:hypothetical protein